MPSESEEKQREFFALRSLLRLSEIVRAVDERRLSWLHFSHLNRPSQCFTLVSSLFPPSFLFIYIANIFTFLPLPNFTPGFPPFYIVILTPVFFCLPSFFFLQAFFNDKYIQEHPEDLEKIEKLKDLIAWQVRPYHWRAMGHVGENGKAS